MSNNPYQSPESDLDVKHSGNNNSGQGKLTKEALPDGVKGWSWGAFLLNWIWAIPNKTWIGLIALIPYVGIIMAIVLGVKGRQWAWQNKRWDSVEAFQKSQKKWSYWGIGLTVGILLLGIIAAVAMPKLIELSQATGN